MAERLTFAAALRRAESDSPNGDYSAVRGLIRGNARLLGAYGIPSDNWREMAEDAGLPGARWQDPAAQDAVVEATLNRLYGQYGDWRLVAIAWKGGEALADAVAEYPQILEHESLAPVKTYAAQVMQFAREDVEANRPVDPEGLPIDPGRFDPDVSSLTPAEGQGRPQPELEAEDVLRRRLIAMRDRARLVGNPGIEDEDLAADEQTAPIDTRVSEEVPV